MWVLTLCALVLFAAAAVALVTAVRVDRHRASTAADLAAIAGAQRAAEGRQASCSTARSVAQANGAAMTRCSLAGDLSLRVSVRVQARLWTGSVTSHARAGPHRSPWSLHTPPAGPVVHHQAIHHRVTQHKVTQHNEPAP
ncbi:hypothetical protein GCM10027570_32880 [Streptomonospora sediminis]